MVIKPILVRINQFGIGSVQHLLGIVQAVAVRIDRVLDVEVEDGHDARWRGHGHAAVAAERPCENICREIRSGRRHEVVCETEPPTGRQLDLKGNRLLRRAVEQDLLPSQEQGVGGRRRGPETALQPLRKVPVEQWHDAQTGAQRGKEGGICRDVVARVEQLAQDALVCVRCRLGIRMKENRTRRRHGEPTDGGCAERERPCEIVRDAEPVTRRPAPQPPFAHDGVRRHRKVVDGVRSHGLDHEFADCDGRLVSPRRAVALRARLDGGGAVAQLLKLLHSGIEPLRRRWVQVGFGPCPGDKGGDCDCRKNAVQALEHPAKLPKKVDAMFMQPDDATSPQCHRQRTEAHRLDDPSE